MGALIGYALGAGLGMAGNAAKQRQAKEQQHDELMLQTYQQHPDLATTDSAQQFLKKKFGADTAEMFGTLGKHYEQFSTQLNQAQPQQGQGQVTQAGNTDPLQQHVAQVNSEIQRMQGLQNQYANDPQKLSLIKQKLDFLQGQAKQFQQESFQKQQATESRQQHEEFHQDTEADRAASREQTKALTEATQAQAKANADFEQQFKQTQQQIQKAKDDETRQQHISLLAKSIDSERDKVLSEFAKLPDAAKPAAEARVNGYNSSAQMFYQKHASEGAPTLLKFTPGEAGTGLRGYAGGKPSVAPTIEAVPPQYVSYKGKAGWMDADNNFYPEQ